MAAAKADMEKQALEMKALMKDPVDVKKIEAKIDEMSMLKAGMQKKCLVHHVAVRALLTDEQKAKLDEMGCGMGCGMMQGMGNAWRQGRYEGAWHENGKKANARGQGS